MKSDEEIVTATVAEAERDMLRIEYESRAEWIAKMLKVLGCENHDGFNCVDPHAVAADLVRERDRLRDGNALLVRDRDEMKRERDDLRAERDLLIAKILSYPYIPQGMVAMIEEEMDR